MHRLFTHQRLAILSLLLLFLITVNTSLYASDELLKVHFLDVGQADSIIIQLPNSKVMVIDAGNNADGPAVVQYLKNLGVQKIDYLIGTHPHEDHIGGLDDLIDSFSIGSIYMPKITSNTKTFEDVLLAVKRKGLKITSASQGLEIISDKELSSRILAPVHADYSNTNNWSIVLKLTFKNISFLFTGDAETEVEEELLQTGTDLRADLLKAGHHGSDTSTSPEFLQAVSPTYAVISVGADNKYGHPAQLTLNLLYSSKVQVFRTDQQGSIVATSDGQKLAFTQEPTTGLVANTISSVVIQSVDLEKEVVIIQNLSTNPQDLSQWKLVSENGQQSFVFPVGTMIQPGGILKILSGKNATNGNNSLVWTRSYIWNNDGDPAILYDASGNIISKYGGI